MGEEQIVFHQIPVYDPNNSAPEWGSDAASDKKEAVSDTVVGENKSASKKVYILPWMGGTANGNGIAAGANITEFKNTVISGQNTKGSMETVYCNISYYLGRIAFWMIFTGFLALILAITSIGFGVLALQTELSEEEKSKAKKGISNSIIVLVVSAFGYMILFGG